MNIVNNIHAGIFNAKKIKAMQYTIITLFLLLFQNHMAKAESSLVVKNSEKHIFSINISVQITYNKGVH